MPAPLLLAEFSNENSCQRFLVRFDAFDFPYLAAINLTIGLGLFCACCGSAANTAAVIRWPLSRLRYVTVQDLLSMVYLLV